MRPYPSIPQTLSLIGTVIVLASDICWGKPDISVVPRPVEAIPLFRNSHATAGAWLVKHHGLKRDGERDKTLVATAWVYMRRCGDCSDSDSVTWDVAGGLASLLKARGAKLTVAERCTRPTSAKSLARFSDLVAAIKAGAPALVTFSYDPRSAKSSTVARGRARKSFTLAAIGTITDGARDYVVARDGLTKPPELLAQDCVSAASLGLGKGVWSQPGTRIYRWHGGQQNIVLVTAKITGGKGAGGTP